MTQKMIRLVKATLRWVACFGAVAIAQAADNYATRPGTWNVPVDTNLPNVLIIGDSISIGYTPEVTALLRGRANVYRPVYANRAQAANSGDTRRGLQQIDDWLGDVRWDVVHFNWGLHDLCYRNPAVTNMGNRDKVHGTLSVPPAAYAANLDQLVRRLRQTGAALIWASTTVVPEDEPGRFVGDELKYNRIAARVMTRHGIAIDDLHAVAASFPTNFFVGPGDVHFTPEGYQKLARQAAWVIESALPPRSPTRDHP
jgi:lysophospholipase L1-like esterase